MDPRRRRANGKNKRKPSPYGATICSKNTDVLVRSRDGENGDEMLKKKMVIRVPEGVLFQRDGERITVQIDGRQMSVPQEDVRVLY